MIGPDHDATEAAARAHRDALASQAPGGSCDAVARLLSGEDPRGCRARPPAELAEVLAVAAVCRDLAHGSARPERDLWIAAQGAWTGAPLAVASCAHAIERVAPRVGWHHAYERPPLPPLDAVVHGARWQAWLVAEANPEQPAWLRGWWEVEEALAHCGPPTGEACLDVLATRGVPDGRVDLRAVRTALDRAATHLDRLDQVHATKRR